jgi:hypothetical protein
MDHYDRAVDLLKHEKHLPSLLNCGKINLAKAKAMNNEKDIEFESLQGYAAANRVKLYDDWMPRYIGEILLKLDDRHLSEAEYWIKKAIDVDKTYGMRWYLGRNYALYGELFKLKGDKARGKENLSKAIEIFKECGADGWVEKYEKELASLS